MKKYDVLDIAIKILGLSLVPNALYWIGQTIVFFMPANGLSSSLGEMDLYSIISMLVGTIFCILPIYLFVFRTKFILHKILKQDPAELTADISVNKQAFIEIACVIIGGIALIRNIPGLFTQIIQNIQIHKLDIDMPANSFPNSWMYRDGSEIILAIIFIVYAKPIAGYFAKRADRSQKIISPNE